MHLLELIKSVEPLECRGDLDLEIEGLYYDSRKVKAGGLFFALKGVAHDGISFIDAAVKAGAVAVVVDETYIPGEIPFVRVADARLAMSQMASAFNGFPTANVPLVGITGTNGKTTTSYLIETILEKSGVPTAVLGTVNYRFRDKIFSAPNTTPESVDLQQTLKELIELGARCVVMEVSSHALEQRRVDGCSFSVGIFTNLTRDHLDYHLTMESYFQSKLRLFSALLVPDFTKSKRVAVVNIDDGYGPRIIAGAACPVLSFGMNDNAEVRAEQVNFSVDGISCNLITPLGSIALHSELLGRFNLYNILAAVSAGIALDLPLDAIRAGIEHHHNVPGRLEKVANDLGITVLVDYAHTGDALENVLSTLAELKKARIITVFGCGGDRDRGKRPVMGEIAGRYSDLSIITSDNPRTEEPKSIIAEVRDGLVPLGIREFSIDELAQGFDGKGYVAVESRRDAIRLAVKSARAGDIILLAGKGHEDYQIVGSEKLHFDDREEAARACLEIAALN